MTLGITSDVAHKLKHYVYSFVDPRNDEVFYIGKGIGARATAHLNDKSESKKVERIASIKAAGYQPRIDIVAHVLRDDEEAVRVEAALIELVGLHRLTNRVRGLHTNEYPRKPLTDFVMECAPRKVDVDIPSILIRINQRFTYGMSDLELYESTRGIWVIGQRRREIARYAMAVFVGVVREVHELESWHPAGSTPYETRDAAELAREAHSRWEFVGHIAARDVRDMFRGCSVEHLFRPGQQSPVVGVNL